MITLQRNWKFVVALTLLAALALAAPALSQPQRDARDGGPNREQMRRMVEQRLDAVRAQQSNLEELLAMLDGGASDEDVRARVRELMRDGMDRFADRRQRRAGDDGDVLGQIDPRLRERFERMQRENPERAQALLEQAAPRLERLREMREQRPEQFQARVEVMRSIHQAMRLAHAIVKAGADGEPQGRIDELRAQFLSKVAEAVDTDLAMRAAALETAESHLDTMRTEADRMRTNRDEIIRTRAEVMLARAARAEVEPRPDGQRRRPRD